ncbi:MAG: hypothetical protein KJZ58_03065 [Flavobacteriales bacterium]|nr:hypothetical protein [Flavobacteriales bacterium]
MQERRLPLSMVTLVFGVLSVPLAFARQLCVPAFIMGVLAVVIHLAGRAKRRNGTWSKASLRNARWGYRAALVGSICALAMWVLWATGVLL